MSGDDEAIKYALENMHPHNPVSDALFRLARCPCPFFSPLTAYDKKVSGSCGIRTSQRDDSSSYEGCLFGGDIIPCLDADTKAGLKLRDDTIEHEVLVAEVLRRYIADELFRLRILSDVATKKS